MSFKGERTNDLSIFDTTLELYKHFPSLSFGVKCQMKAVNSLPLVSFYFEIDINLYCCKMANGYLLALAEEERLKRQLFMDRRLLRAKSNPLELPDCHFVANFRLTKALYRELCEELTPLLVQGRRRSAVRPDIKVLAALAFYANSAYQKNIGAYYHLGLSQTKVHDCLHEVTEALNTPHILGKYIKFPITQVEREAEMTRFQDRFQFPGVLGCIDGTHVAMIRPSDYEEAYFNRKFYHSLNVLVICNADLRIFHVDASFGGASHDSHIWNQCPVRGFMQRLHDDGDVCWLLGDSGYAQRPWLMTPILDAAPNSPEEHYTQRHVRTRNVVERCIGVLKTRWRCLLAHRVLHYAPIKAGKIVNACVVLHNLVNDDRIPIHEVINDDLALQIHIQRQDVVDEGRQAVVDRLWRGRRN